jgi:hypothetical protein
VIGRLTIDRIFVGAALAALAVAGFLSARWGAIGLGLVFFAGALVRRRGLPSLLLTQRRQRTDVFVLSAFAVALVVLAAVLPRG